MNALIAQNPHTEKPEEFFKELDQMNEIPSKGDQLDREGFENLKILMSQGRGISVK